MKKTTLQITRWKEKGLSVLLIVSLFSVFFVSLNIISNWDSVYVHENFFYSNSGIFLFPWVFFTFWLFTKIMANIFNLFKDMEGFREISFNFPLWISVLSGVFMFSFSEILFGSFTNYESVNESFFILTLIFFFGHFIINLFKMFGYTIKEETIN